MNTVDAGSRLKELRKQKGFSLRVFAEQIGIHYTHLSKIESDKVKPSTKLILKMAEHLKIDSDAILIAFSPLSDWTKCLFAKPSFRFFRDAFPVLEDSDWKAIHEFMEHRLASKG